MCTGSTIQVSSSVQTVRVVALFVNDMGESLSRALSFWQHDRSARADVELSSSTTGGDVLRLSTRSNVRETPENENDSAYYFFFLTKTTQFIWSSLQLTHGVPFIATSHLTLRLRQVTQAFDALFVRIRRCLFTRVVSSVGPCTSGVRIEESTMFGSSRGKDIDN